MYQEFMLLNLHPILNFLRDLIYFSYLEPAVEEMESNDKEAVDDGFESYEDSEDFEDAGQVILVFCFENCPDLQ